MKEQCFNCFNAYTCACAIVYVRLVIGNSTVREMASKAENLPTSKKPRLSLSLKRNRKEPTSSSRFVVASDVDVEKAAKGVLPNNTA